MIVEVCFYSVLQYLDVAGYISGLMVCKCAFALKGVIDLPDALHWTDIDKALPILLSTVVKKPIRLEVYAGDNGLCDLRRGRNMRFYDPVVYYAGSVSGAEWHMSSFWCLLSFALFPCICFSNLGSARALQQAVSMLVDVFDATDMGPQAVRLAGLKADECAEEAEETKLS